MRRSTNFGALGVTVRRASKGARKVCGQALNLASDTEYLISTYSRGSLPVV